jgi:hypothetical protein
MVTGQVGQRVMPQPGVPYDALAARRGLPHAAATLHTQP